MDSKLAAEVQRDAISSCFQNFMTLFDSMLHECRVKLEQAEGNEVLKLQGEVRAIKELLTLKRAALKITHHDGAFD
jgi:hypothetical protein